MTNTRSELEASTAAQTSSSQTPVSWKLVDNMPQTLCLTHFEVDSFRCNHESKFCDACLARQEVCQRISEVERHLAKLREEEREILSQMNVAHDPFQRMPPEVVSVIFEQTLDTNTSGAPFGPFALGLVCRYWRRLAWATPSLWSCLTFFLNRTRHDNDEAVLREASFKERIEILQDCISRSGALPLSLSINYDWKPCGLVLPSDAILPLIEVITRPVVMGRIARLALVLPEASLLPLTTMSVPLPRHLEFFRADQDVSNFSNLYTSTDLLVAHLSRFSLTKLRSIDIACTPLNLFDLIRQTPLLRTCICKLKMELPTYTQDSRVVLTQLNSLRIVQPNGANINSLFEFFTLPALQRLDIWPQAEAHCLVSFFQRSRCTLKTLYVAGEEEWTLSELEFLLDSLPELSSLYIDDTVREATASQVFRTVFASSTAPYAARSITKFQYSTEWKVADDWNFILQLFRHATPCQGKKTVHIDLYTKRQQETPWMSMEVIQLIWKLEGQGWKWTIEAHIKNGQQMLKDFVGASLIYHQQNTQVLA